MVVDGIDRRALLSTVVASLCFAARRAAAQPAGAPQVGLIHPNTPDNPVERAHVDGFLAGLQEAGFEWGKNVRVEIRYAYGKLDRLPTIARELATLPVAAIVTANPFSTRAAREATRTIPILVALDYETDPVARGWITSLSRPGGNVTGLFLDQPEMCAKLVQLLTDCAPSVTKVAVLWDDTIAQAQYDATTRAARTSRLGILSLRVRRPEDLRGAFETAGRQGANGLVVLTSHSSPRAECGGIAELALRHRLPGITLFTTFPAFGFLMAYGPDQTDAFRRAASQYLAPVLRGVRPANLPVQRPEKFRRVVSAKTAKALGIEVTQSVLLRADEVLQ